ncbi:hypothetical protein, partial [Sinorhizobium meliloti]|uniref:hypothetical protein n=1 Tax=Rhizobium meliloti TaxID=382 RepID=UPI001AECC6B2
GTTLASSGTSPKERRRPGLLILVSTSKAQEPVIEQPSFEIRTSARKQPYRLRAGEEHRA